ncbi:regulatory GntR family protein [Curtobacterium sp. PhB42]|uniref:GntR family transcriptional regulator n=1 Tax=unclassified Curtobacterium TaxID=257496 RepID=UPI00106275BB|nr:MULTISPECIES: winged helix-turn-helix domain-containing protein [unclassified Curtobacterium]TDW39675.1 regulatory GntR family protein [Curtobacterium sp. PhB42]TDW50782.1 regulatory GntR family protein [Curtobacterium sp. PhB190]
MSDEDETPVHVGAFRIVLPARHRSSGLLQHRVEQLVRDAIADGTLRNGDQLPPYRVAAATSGLSINTILNAYRALIRDDLLRAVPGRGYFIGGPVRYRDFFAGCVGDCSRVDE